MRPSLALATLAAVVTLSSGCLRKDTTHTLYLSPDGSVRWVAIESDVWSDETDPASRLAEEQRYLGAALLGAHPIAMGLQALRPDVPVTTTVIREERPFHVVTTAGFGRADRMLERLFTASGVTAAAKMSFDGGRSTLRIHFDFRAGTDERASAATVLLEELEDLRFVLTEGRFIGGGGFDVPVRGGAATLSGEWLSAAEDAMEARRTIDLVLAWEADS
jgi:hypothetical protein